MTKQQHTPRPWVASQNAYGVWFVNGGEEHNNGRVKYRDLVCGGNSHDTLNEANARLIAAAPELLEAAEQWAVILTVGIMHSEPAEVLDAMDALAGAVAKARGETSHD